jgi:hypothetical protein
VPRFLPPLLLALFFGLIAARCLGEPARAEAQEQIEGLVQGGELDRARQRLHEYLERYGEDDDRWFAARLHVRMAQPGRAIAVLWDDASIAADPATPRRFAELALYALGWSDARRTEPTVLEPLCLVALVEGGDPWAVARLREYASTLDLMHTTAYFFPAYLQATRPPMNVMVDAFRQRSDDDRFRTAAGLGAMRQEDYPGRADDLKRLEEVVGTTGWRGQLRIVWCSACLALGRSGEASALETLQAVRKRLEGSRRKQDQLDLQLVLAGLVAAGDWTADEPVAQTAFGDEPDPIALVWYLEALIHRYREGDARSEGRLVQMWEGPGAKFQDLRNRQSRAFLLQEKTPDDEATRIWVDRMLGQLESAQAPPIAHIIAASYRLRRKLPGAREAFLVRLRDLGNAIETGDPEAYSDAFLEALRALYLYG